MEKRIEISKKMDELLEQMIEESGLKEESKELLRGLKESLGKAREALDGEIFEKRELKSKFQMAKDIQGMAKVGAKAFVKAMINADFILATSDEFRVVTKEENEGFLKLGDFCIAVADAIQLEIEDILIKNLPDAEAEKLKKEKYDFLIKSSEDGNLSFDEKIRKEKAEILNNR